MKNIAILAIGVISFPIGFIGSFGFNLGFTFQEYFVFIGFVSGVIFVNMTFHRQKMKKGYLILVIVVLLGIIQITFFHLYYPLVIKGSFLYYIRVLLDLPYTLVVYNWFAYSFNSAYNRLKNKNIQPWIKMRYKLIAFSSLFMSFHSIPEFFQPINVIWGDPNNLISLVIFGITAHMAIIYAVIFSISWFMPKKLKAYYNKDYKKEEEEIDYTEEELMEIIKNQLNDKKEK